MISKKILANTLRVLSMDAVQKANSGHPGAPMGMADIAEVLWRDYLNHNPNNPKWINRDRFILSNGHGSILLYSLLHLTGYNISIRDLQNFRQFDSKTPGHPEYKHTEGVETTTGPLGQGIANAIGMAISEKTLAAQFNRPELNIINHYTYVFVGDGCMMEGISHEVCSLAGILKLGKLIVFYDDNNISIDGNVKNWFNDDTSSRFKSYGWHVIPNIDGHDSEKINIAINEAKMENDKPSLLICKTIIAYGSPNKSGSSKAHGTPLGEQEIIKTRKILNWNFPPFIISPDIYQAWNAKIKGQKKEDKWNNIFNIYKKKYPELSEELERRINGNLPKNWQIITKKYIQKLQLNPKNIATRQASQNSLDFLSKILPELLGGSADLTPSNLTNWSTSKSINKYNFGNYINYGVREFGMTAIANGISCYKGFIPFSATFLVFVDYARSAVRMAALMKIRHIMIYTHDSIGLGEDGPTHQPIEQLSSLRIIPNLSVWRPCDQVETIVSWKKAIEKIDGPTALILSRQNLVQQKRSLQQIDNIAKGGYILIDSDDNQPKLIIISTGSEVNLAVIAQKKLLNQGYKVRVVSMPSTNDFDLQDIQYKESVLPNNIKLRIAIEAGITNFWYKYVGDHGEIIGVDKFGKSGSEKDLFNFFNLTVDYIIKKSIFLLNRIKF